MDIERNFFKEAPDKDRQPERAVLWGLFYPLANKHGEDAILAYLEKDTDVSHKVIQGWLKGLSQPSPNTCNSILESLRQFRPENLPKPSNPKAAPKPEVKKQRLEIIDAAQHHLLTLLKRESGFYATNVKLFRDPKVAYALYEIIRYLKLPQSQVISLLDSIQGFERINAYGTSKATAYKLTNPQLAISDLEKLLDKGALPE